MNVRGRLVEKDPDEAEYDHDKKEEQKEGNNINKRM